VEFLPSYSPDGRRILFSSYRSGNSEIYLYERADGTLRRLTDNDACDAHAEFSGDGAKILFHRMVAKREDGGYDFDLHSYDGASGEERRLTSTPHEESYGSWAPDGSWTRDGEYVCFNSERRGTTDIFRMRMKGLDCERAGRAR
jgi:Tol biopolymer transport system component